MTSALSTIAALLVVTWIAGIVLAFKLREARRALIWRNLEYTVLVKIVEQRDACGPAKSACRDCKYYGGCPDVPHDENACGDFRACEEG